MQVVDAVLTHGHGGGTLAQAACTSEAETGIPCDTLIAIFRSYATHAGSWRLVKEYIPDFTTQIDTPTLLCRLLDMLAKTSHDFSAPLYTSVWTEFGVTPADRQTILTAYLQHNCAWASHTCETSLL
jgi:hypothetical protein